MRSLLTLEELCSHWTFSIWHIRISTSLLLPDRSQQLFGPCLFSSAYQHALVPVINIGECHFSVSSSLNAIPGSWINRILSVPFELSYLFCPTITMLTDYSSQGSVFCFRLPPVAVSSRDQGAHHISSTIRRPWRQKLNTKKSLHSATQRLTVLKLAFYIVGCVA